jgi:hypothetical protein
MILNAYNPESHKIIEYLVNRGTQSCLEIEARGRASNSQQALTRHIVRTAYATLTHNVSDAVREMVLNPSQDASKYPTAVKEQLWRCGFLGPGERLKYIVYDTLS